MQGELPTKSSAPTGAVFLSYASQDADAARRICDALRASGIEVWFDQSELRGGDAWDRRIREQIHDCRLFIPVISANSESRDEGYFRREWSLAVDRTRDMAQKRAFLVPVVIDGTPERGASVPEKFHELQWTRLPGGETPGAFVERVRRLLSPEAAAARAPAPTPPASATVRPSGKAVASSWRSRAGPWAIGAVLAVALAYIAADKFLVPRRSSTSPMAPSVSAAQTAAPTRTTQPAFNPPPHSIAVLPFVNMSGEKEQEYFSDGLTEEILSSLARINELQVAARTSSFYFRGRDVDLNTVAHKLNVASILEGSVRRSGHTVRVTAQLNNAVTGYHLWSQTYDRDLKDVLRLQTEIATAVANALKLTLLGDLATKVELGGTRNPAAFDAYIRASKIHLMASTAKEYQSAIDGLTQALRLDPDYALAYAARSIALSTSAGYSATSVPVIRANLDRALADARKSIVLAPDLADAHVALAGAYESSLEFMRAGEEFQRALMLAPANARVLRDYGVFSVFMGRGDYGITMLRRAVALDPLNYVSHLFLGQGLRALRRYDEAIMAISDGLALEPAETLHRALEPAATLRTELGITQYLLGDLQAARASCEPVVGEHDLVQQCLAMTYHKQGRDAEAETALANLKAVWRDSGPTVYAAVYAQWGDSMQALEWLETAARLHTPGLEEIKTNPLLDPLRNEARFQAIERALKFPTD